MMGFLEKIWKKNEKDEETLKSTLNVRSGPLGYTKLHNAVFSKKPDKLRQLLEYGADVNLMSDGGYTPLHIAASIDAFSCIEVLLEYNACTTICDENKRTPYDTAVYYDSVNSARLLLSHDVLTSLKQRRHVDFVKYLETARSKSVTPDCFDKCLKLAVENNNFTVIGVIMLRKPRNAKECLIDAIIKTDSYKFDALKMPDCSKSTLLLLLCYAVEKHFNDVIKVICENKDFETDKSQWLKCDVQISAETLHHLKLFIMNIKEYFAFPISIGCNPMVKNYEGVKYMLLNIFSDNKNLKADWRGLKLGSLHEDWLRNLTSFKDIVLSYNEIKTIPSTDILNYFGAVEKLNLSSNKLQEVPEELFRLPKLCSIDLSQNKLRHLPNVKEWSPSLTTITLKSNLLESFPSNVEGLLVKYLYLAYNRLDCVPESICNLKCLETLDISQNVDIHSLPVSMGKLSKLTQLDLDGLTITDPPSENKTSREILNLLIEKLRYSKPYYKMKLMIIGFPQQGKTTLLKRLKGDNNFNLDKSTQGIDIEEIIISFQKKEPFVFRVWDFAGQEEYFATHQCFLSSSSLYLLVWDVTKKDQCTQLLQPWFENLVARLKVFYIIVVGTKIDLLNNNDLDKACHLIKTEIKALIETIPAVRNLKNSDKDFSCRLKICFVSSDTKFHNYHKGIQTLKKEIYILAETMTSNGKQNGDKIMGKLFPQSYLKLEEEINEIKKNEKHKIPIISREEFILIGKHLKSDFDKFQVEDLEPATKFLMNTGTILHFDSANEDLRDIVFINPSWVCKLMSKFITVDAVHTFVKNGILEQDKIPLILKEELENQNPDIIKKYLSLLSRFQVACKIDDYRVLIPPKLPNYDPKHSLLINLNSLLTRYYFFSCIPYGFWARFITRFLSMIKEMLSPNIEIKPNVPILSSSLPKDEMDVTRYDCSKKNKNNIYNECLPNISAAGIVIEEDKFSSEIPFNEEKRKINNNQQKNGREKNQVFFANYMTGKIDFQECSKSISPVNENSFFCHLHSDVINVSKELKDCATCNFETNTNASDRVAIQEINLAAVTNEIHQSTNYTTPYCESNFKQNCDLIINELIIDSADNLSNCNDNCGDDKIQKSTNFNISSDFKYDPISDSYTDALSDDNFSANDDEENTETDGYMQMITERLHVGCFDASKQVILKQKYENYVCTNEEAKEEDDEIESQFINELSNSDEIYEEHFNDYGELAYLLDNGYLSCWNKGIIFNHPQLSFSIQQLPVLYKADRETIEICVTKSSLGYRILSYVVDHIRTLLNEWYEGLLMSDSQVISTLACPVCITLGINPPHLFNISTAFQKILESSEDNTCNMLCEQEHIPKTINIAEYCPELTLQDLPKTMKYNYNDIYCEKNEKYKLGEGQYGKVYIGLFKNKIVAAIKFYKFNMNTELSSSLDQFYEIRQEILMLSKLRHHPYIIQFLGFLIKPELCAVMEYARHGALSSVIHKRSKFIPRIVKFRICQQIASALAFMHKKCIIHRDIKSDNILLFSLNHNSKINIKLTDFGTANIMSPSGLKTFFGTKGYAAPEMIMYQSYLDEYTSSVDIYSFGMVVYELIAYRRPFNDILVQFIDNQVINGFRPKFYDVPDAFYGLINLTKLMITMWNQESSKRPHANDVLNMLLSPTFQLVFGLKMLHSTHKPRGMCYITSCKELWISCDDKKYQSIIVVINMESFQIVKKIQINGERFGLQNFNISSMTSIGNKHVCVLLRSLNDVILVYEAQNYIEVQSHKIMDSYICSISANKNWVCLGFDDGHYSKFTLSNFLNGKINKKHNSSNLTENSPIKTSVLLPESFIWSAGCSFMYCNFKKNKEKKVLCYNEQKIEEIVLSFDEKFFFISYQSSPDIHMYSAETKEALYIFSCRIDVLKCSPEALDVDVRVTCMCSVVNMLWVGTGGGHILIYDVYEVGGIYKTKLLQTLHPYAIEMQKLLLVDFTQAREDGVKYVIVSIGKELNKNAFGFGSFLDFNGYVPKDQTAIDNNLCKHLDNDCDEGNDGKVIIVWHVLPSHYYKNLVLS
ncbi:leucine-rich repeat serine/threonine-protein kinase 2 isoform X2 [Hydra vulgaris]|uniref:leucine-rich repeat serine/threonine-protein kinase 2 isoform X2 n=2 Tax=Hydra vulgaris TaxID=6087 RepID=UPI001F5EB8E2|nr:leucine-rich repeat serine/threonine-protein kinase 2-like isoform X2 [Hydra vulgaris]